MVYFHDTNTLCITNNIKEVYVGRYISLICIWYNDSVLTSNRLFFMK